MGNAENLGPGNVSHHAQPDADLWIEIKNGNRSAFSALYKKHVRNLYKYGFFLIHDKDIVEDAIHDVFIKIWNARNNQIDIHNLKAYLYISVRREVIHAKQKLNRPTYQLDDIDDQLSDQPSVEDIWIKSESEKNYVDKIRTFINNLSARQREIIFLRYYQNLSYQEISDLLKIDQNYAYNLTSKAFNQLRKQFEKTLS